MQPGGKKGIASLCSEQAKERGGNFSKKKECKSVCSSQVLVVYVFVGNSNVSGISYGALLQRNHLFCLVSQVRQS